MIPRFPRDQVAARNARAHGLVETVESVIAAIIASAGICGSAPTSHLGLAARLDGYAPIELEGALEERSVRRVPGMRGPSSSRRSSW